jgi:hypothetical protein
MDRPHGVDLWVVDRSLGRVSGGISLSRSMSSPNSGDQPIMRCAEPEAASAPFQQVNLQIETLLLPPALLVSKLARRVETTNSGPKTIHR